MKFTSHKQQSQTQCFRLECEGRGLQAEKHPSLTTPLPPVTQPEKPCLSSYKAMEWRKDFCLTRSALGRAGISLSIRVESHKVHGIECVRNQPLQMHHACVSWHHYLQGRKRQILPDNNSNAYQVFSQSSQ